MISYNFVVFKHLLSFVHKSYNLIINFNLAYKSNYYIYLNLLNLLFSIYNVRYLYYKTGSFKVESLSDI